MTSSWGSVLKPWRWTPSAPPTQSPPTWKTPHRSRRCSMTFRMTRSASEEHLALMRLGFATGQQFSERLVGSGLTKRLGDSSAFKSYFIFIVVFQGACILNMLRDFLTPEAFEIGIIRYLKRFSYQNTVSSHLWESLTGVSVCVCTVPSHLPVMP